MALSGRGYFIDSYIPIYPGTFNAWLRNNNGYKCIGMFEIVPLSILIFFFKRSFSFSFFPFFSILLTSQTGGDCDNLVLDAPNGISPSHISFISEDEKPDINTMKAYVQKLNPVMVAHVSYFYSFCFFLSYLIRNLLYIFFIFSSLNIVRFAIRPILCW